MYQGRWVYYDANGNIIGVGNYDHGNGMQRAWWPNGKLKREVPYVNNEKKGEERFYNEEGKLEKVIEHP